MTTKPRKNKNSKTANELELGRKVSQKSLADLCLPSIRLLYAVVLNKQQEWVWWHKPVMLALGG